MSKHTAVMPKGGYREGAGRKPRDPSAPLSRTLTPLAVRLSEELRERFQAKAKQKGMTEAEAARDAIQRWIDADD